MDFIYPCAGALMYSGRWPSPVSASNLPREHYSFQSDWLGHLKSKDRRAQCILTQRTKGEYPKSLAERKILASKNQLHRIGWRKHFGWGIWMRRALAMEWDDPKLILTVHNENVYTHTCPPAQPSQAQLMQMAHQDTPNPPTHPANGLRITKGKSYSACIQYTINFIFLMHMK